MHNSKPRLEKQREEEEEERRRRGWKTEAQSKSKCIVSSLSTLSPLRTGPSLSRAHNVMNSSLPSLYIIYVCMWTFLCCDLMWSNWISNFDSKLRRSREREGGRRLLMSFKETPSGGNATFDCSPSGPCVACLYSEKVRLFSFFLFSFLGFPNRLVKLDAIWFGLESVSKSCGVGFGLNWFLFKEW